MNASEVIAIPLSKLNPIVHGVRKTNGIKVDELAASIRAEGLLQNLTVIVDQDTRGNYIVSSGNRRLRALHALRDGNEIPADFAVPCRVIDESSALPASLAENTIRQAMHPADEFVAFKEMIDAGRSPEDIAARFGVTPIVVARRLKLAKVSPKLFEIFRNNGMTLDQMMALALSDDHKAQEKAWNVSDSWRRRPEELRATLTKKEIDLESDPVGRFVGRADFEAAGGVVHVDLFSDTGGGFATDAALLRKLAAEKLQKVADQVKREAWSWVKTTPKLDDLYTYSKATPASYAKYTDQEKKRLAQMTEDLAATVGEGLEAQRRRSDLRASIAFLQESKQVFDPKILGQTGAIVTIEHGAIKVYRGLSKGKIRQVAPKKGTTTKGADGNAKPAAAKLGHSDALVVDMTSRITYAIRAELIATPGVAIIALTHRLAAPLFYSTAGMYDAAVRIESDSRFSQLQDIKADDSADVAKLEAEHKRLAALMPKKAGELFAWLASKECGRETLIAILDYCVAYSIDVSSPSEKSNRGADLIDALKLDMSTRWNPRLDNYASRISAAQLLASLAEAGMSKAELARCGKMKKLELAGEASKFLASKNWLPKPLRVGARAPVARAKGKK